MNRRFGDVTGAARRQASLAQYDSFTLFDLQVAALLGRMNEIRSTRPASQLASQPSPLLPPFFFFLGASERVERSARTVATDRPPQETLHAKQNITRLLFFLIIRLSVHPPPLPATTSTPLPFPVMAMTEAAQLDHVESGVIAGMIFFITQHPPTKPQHPPTKPARSPPPSLSADGNRLVRLCSSLASYTVTPVLPYRPPLFPPEGCPWLPAHAELPPRKMLLA